jgi:hypothetical protein
MAVSLSIRQVKLNIFILKHFSACANALLITCRCISKLTITVLRVQTVNDATLRQIVVSDPPKDNVLLPFIYLVAHVVLELLRNEKEPNQHCYVPVCGN